MDDPLQAPHVVSDITIRRTRHGGYLVSSLENDYNRTFELLYAGSLDSVMDFIRMHLASGDA